MLLVDCLKIRASEAGTRFCPQYWSKEDRFTEWPQELPWASTWAQKADARLRKEAWTALHDFKLLHLAASAHEALQATLRASQHAARMMAAMATTPEVVMGVRDTRNRLMAEQAERERARRARPQEPGRRPAQQEYQGPQGLDFQVDEVE